jgi:glycolate dehydrogenase FAD-binding subunit
MTAQDPQPLPDALAQIVGEQHVWSDQTSCPAYAVQSVVPGCVVAPGSKEDLAAVLSVAQGLRAAVVPWGGGTQQNIGAPPERVDLIVRTDRLSRVLVHEPSDLTISVEAGMTMVALRDYLVRHGQMLPIDPPLPARATIGGLIATATDGPRRLGYGTLRDLLIGITVVEAGGRITKGGGMVVKNVSGFDMMKLYLGSFGTLAIVASANFKLLPIPRAAASLLCTFDTPTNAFATLEALQLTQLTPTAAEYLNTGALAALGFAGSCGLVLRAEGLEAAVERHMTDMADLARRNMARDLQRIDGAADTDVWGRIADLAQTADLANDEALFKLAVLPAEVERTVAQIEALGAQSGLTAIVSARGLNGVIYARLRPVTASGLTELRAALPATLWIATTLAGVPRWGAQPAGLDLIQRIKNEFDPLGILNKGRFVDGI